MTLSANFTVNGVANPAAHTAAYASTVTLALTSISDVDSVSFSIVGTSKSGTAFPTITEGGTPTGATSTFALPSDPGDGLGRSYRVKCTVTSNATGDTVTSYGVVGTANASGVLPIALGEELDRDATYGWANEVNASLARPSIVYAEASSGNTAAQNQTAIQAAIDAQSSGIVQLPRGLIDHTGEFTLKANITVRGYGKMATRLRSSHTGRGMRMQSTVNSSTAVHLKLEDFSIENTNGANTDGAIVDNCGTFIDLVNIRTVGYKYGLVLDQSELVNVQACDFETPIKAGIWLVNGDEYTATAAVQFTNRINVFGNCQFNGGEYGIMDDGGYSHVFEWNNHNGATVAHIRCAGALPCSITDCEMEVGPVGVLLSALSESGDTAAGAGSYTIDRNIIVVDDYAVSVESAGLINANDNLLYGDYAFTGMSNCSIANGKGNSLPGVAVRTIYQDNLATLHEDWAIPETGTISENVFRKNRVNDLGVPLIWYLGDDRGAITDYSGTPDYFTTFKNRGALGGTLDGASTNRPEISTFYTGKIAPIFGNGGTYDNLLSSLSVGNFTFLHNAATNYTLTARVRTSSLAANQTILATFNSTLTNYGIYLYVTTAGALTLLMANGSGVAALNIASAGGVIVANTNHTIQITTSGTAATVYVDGTSVASGTITSPSATAASTTLYVGSHAGAVPWIGLLPEIIIQLGAQDAVQRSLMSTYIGRWA